jgi:hypothetical protein
MVLAEKVREQVVTMMASEMIVEARAQMMTPKTIVEAPVGLSEIHHSQGL